MAGGQTAANNKRKLIVSIDPTCKSGEPTLIWCYKTIENKRDAHLSAVCMACNNQVKVLGV